MDRLDEWSEGHHSIQKGIKRKISTDLPFTLSEQFINLLETVTRDHEGGCITVTFKDPTYSKTYGEFHPVEIRIESGRMSLLEMNEPLANVEPKATQGGNVVH